MYVGARRAVPETSRQVARPVATSISADQAARVHELAKRILQEIGLKVQHAGALERLQAEGFRVDGNRAFFDPQIVETYVQDMREWMEEREYESVEQLKGSMSQKSIAEPAAYERALYVQALQSYRT